MKLLFPILFLLLLASCVNQSGGGSRVDCVATKPVEPAEKIPHPALSGTVYHFHENVDRSSCMLADEKDSVGWDLVLLNDSQFVQVSYFPADMYIKKGIYDWKDDSLALHYSTVLVDRIHSKVTSTVAELQAGQEIKTIPLTPENKLSDCSASTDLLSLHKCEEGTIYFNWTIKGFEQYLPPDDGVKTDIKADEYVKRLKEAGVWEMLYSKK